MVVHYCLSSEHMYIQKMIHVHVQKIIDELYDNATTVTHVIQPMYVCTVHDLSQSVFITVSSTLITAIIIFIVFIFFFIFIIVVFITVSITLITAVIVFIVFIFFVFFIIVVFITVDIIIR